MTDRIGPGDSINIIECKHCHHVSEVDLPPTTTPLVPGKAPQELRHTCLKCGESQRVQRSDILHAVVSGE